MLECEGDLYSAKGTEHVSWLLCIAAKGTKVSKRKQLKEKPGR